MKDFFKMMLASMVGFILASVIFSLLSLIMFAMVIAMVPREDISIPKEGLLHVKLDMPLYDRGHKMPFDSWGSGFGGKRPLGLNQIIRSIDEAATDDRIKGVYLEMGYLQTGLASVTEIRDALQRFSKSGKPVIAYGEQITQKSYYLASASDRIFVNPKGMLEFSGLTAQVAFIKGLNEKLKVEMQVIRPSNNTYKSAVEPFILDKMSEANREQTGKYLGSGWDIMLKGISEKRGVDIEFLNILADSLVAFRPEKAMEFGLIDGLIYKDQLDDSLMVVMGIKDKDDLKLVSIGKYIKATQKENIKIGDNSKNKNENKIAVIYTEGSIQMGDSEDDLVISSEYISSTIRKAREDDDIKSIVLRVNSPGGDGLASEIIWREVALAARKKPVIVSMGDYAASGGYYISCAATRILAQPNTLTGSIGVFGVVPNMQKLFSDHLGITFDEVKTNKNSSFGNIMRPLEPYEYQFLQNYVNDFYTHFLSRVAEGRKMSPADVDSIAQGRVWSGEDALEIGLIDEIGGLNDAIKIAASEAKLKNYTIIEWPCQTDPFTRLIKELSGETHIEKSIRQQLGSSYPVYEMLMSFGNQKGIQARIPFVISVN